MPKNTAKKNIAKNGEALEATWIPNDFKGFGKEQKYPLCAFTVVIGGQAVTGSNLAIDITKQ